MTHYLPERRSRHSFASPLIDPTPIDGDDWVLPSARTFRRDQLQELALSLFRSEGAKDVSVWNVEHDASVGWEVTSRVLSDLDGFLEVDLACHALESIADDLGLEVNHLTGTHVHIGWLGKDVAEATRHPTCATI